MYRNNVVNLTEKEGKFSDTSKVKVLFHIYHIL